MPTLRRLTALALARAMLAGPPRADGLAARMRACLGSAAAWCAPLASVLERDIGYRHAWLADEKPTVRRYLLRERTRMPPLPLGLHRCHVPYWPHAAALAQWLGVSAGGPVHHGHAGARATAPA